MSHSTLVCERLQPASRHVSSRTVVCRRWKSVSRVLPDRPDRHGVEFLWTNKEDPPSRAEVQEALQEEFPGKRFGNFQMEAFSVDGVHSRTYWMRGTDWTRAVASRKMVRQG